MLAPWANTIVICTLGLSLGTALVLMQRFTPRALEEAMRSRSEREGVLRGYGIRPEDTEYLWHSPEARRLRIVTLVWMGLIVVLVVTLWLSPVELGWWTLLFSMFAGGGVTELVFRRARAGKLHVSESSQFDPLAKMESKAAATESGQLDLE